MACHHDALLGGQRLLQPHPGKLEGYLRDQVVQEARRIMSDLRPSMLDDLGILKTLDWFCREFQQLHPGIHSERAIEIAEDEVPDPLKIIIFRLAQEAFHNIAKHSRAEYVTLALGDSEEMITLVVGSIAVFLNRVVMTPTFPFHLSSGRSTVS